LAFAEDLVQLAIEVRALELINPHDRISHESAPMASKIAINHWIGYAALSNM
jgi:hypothetical protein